MTTKTQMRLMQSAVLEVQIFRLKCELHFILTNYQPADAAVMSEKQYVLKKLEAEAARIAATTKG